MKFKVTLVPESELLPAIMKLEQIGTKDYLLSIAQPFFDILAEPSTWYVDRNGNPCVNPLMQKGKIIHRSTLIKSKIAYFAALFLTVEANVRQFVEVMDPKLRTVYVKMAEKWFVGSEYINEVLGPDTVSYTKSWYSDNRVQIRPPLALTCVRYLTGAGTRAFSDINNVAYLGLPVLFTTYTRSLLLPKISDTPPVIDTASDWFADLEIYSGQTTIGESLNILNELFKSGQLSQGSNKLLTASNLKRTAVSMPTRSPDSWGKGKLMSWASDVVSLTYVAFRYSQQHIDEHKEFLKELFTCLPKLIIKYSQLMGMTLPHISGISTTIAAESFGFSIATQIIELLTPVSAEENPWIRLDWLADKINRIPDSQKAYLFSQINAKTSSQTYMNGRYLDVSSLKFPELDREVIPSTLYDDCGRPFVYGFVMMLASLGYVEVALEEPDPDNPICINGIVCARFSSIGLYVTGITDDVNIMTSDPADSFDVSAERLIVRTIGQRVPFQGWLKEYGRYIGSNRYLFSEASLLSKCNDRMDIEGAREFFRKNICPHLPQIWSDLFDNLLIKSRAVTADITSFEIFSISPNDTALQRYITECDKMKGKVYRAEGYRVLVRKEYVTTFRTLLRARGYLL